MTQPKTIVPLLTQQRPAGVEGLAQAANLTYHNGTILTNVEVVLIFWGAAWTQSDQSGLISQLNQFFDFILTSPYIDLLGEYSVPGYTIGYGSRIGTFPITDTEPGDGSGQVTDTQIQEALQTWIDDGTIPFTTNNTLYFVYLPPDVVCVMSDGSQSCQVFCGYHNQINGTIFYAVEPFLTCDGCMFGQTFDSLTVVSSHELCEAITDPALDAWYDDSTGEEIGDICNTVIQQFGGYNIQAEWSNSANACLFQPANLTQSLNS
jgi:hypothetical protein